MEVSFRAWWDLGVGGWGGRLLPTKWCENYSVAKSHSPEAELEVCLGWAEPKLLLPDLWSVSSIGKGWRVRSSAELFSQ